jgi:thiaminase (transcriptional activator TenA)
LSLSERLRADCAAEWARAARHRFTVELGDDALPDAVYRRYLVQDYAFIGTLARMIAFGIAKAPDMPAMAGLSRFLAMLTSAENTYFIRSFDALGVPEAERGNPTLHPVSQAFLAALREAGEAGGYADVIATLLPAEWIYLDWASAQAGKPRPKRFWLAEWIDLHAGPDFAAFVGWLKGELDRAGPPHEAACRRRFRRMVELEAAFFDAAYEDPR